MDGHLGGVECFGAPRRWGCGPPWAFLGLGEEQRTKGMIVGEKVEP